MAKREVCQQFENFKNDGVLSKEKNNIIIKGSYQYVIAKTIHDELLDEYFTAEKVYEKCLCALNRMQIRPCLYKLLEKGFIEKKDRGLFGATEKLLFYIDYLEDNRKEIKTNTKIENKEKILNKIQKFKRAAKHFPRAWQELDELENLILN
ncbi:MAG: hypothetical protein ACOC2U_05465 [bacterium]